MKLTDADVSSGEAQRKTNGNIYCKKCVPLFEHTTSMLLQAVEPSSAIVPGLKDNGGSKFWFCESCGKRLDENDLREGEAKDKKLKGVFCRSCAVGVSTMSADVITLDTISATKKKGAKRGGKDSEIGVRPAAPRRVTATAAVSSTARSKSQGGLAAAVVAGVIVLAVGLLLLTRGPGAEKRAIGSKAEIVKSPEPKPAPAAARTAGETKPALVVTPAPTPIVTPPPTIGSTPAPKAPPAKAPVPPASAVSAAKGADLKFDFETASAEWIGTHTTTIPANGSKGAMKGVVDDFFKTAKRNSNRVVTLTRKLDLTFTPETTIKFSCYITKPAKLVVFCSDLTGAQLGAIEPNKWHDVKLKMKDLKMQLGRGILLPRTTLKTDFMRISMVAQPDEFDFYLDNFSIEEE